MGTGVQLQRGGGWHTRTSYKPRGNQLHHIHDQGQLRATCDGGWHVQLYVSSFSFNVNRFGALIDNSTKYVQQNAQMFQYQILHSKHYAFNMFQSVMDHLQGGPTPIVYKTRIKVILG